MMELSYAQHYSTTGDQPPRSSVRQASHSSTTPNHTGVDITFTATTGASGSLLIGKQEAYHLSLTRPIPLGTADAVNAVIFLPSSKLVCVTGATMQPHQIEDLQNVVSAGDIPQ